MTYSLGTLGLHTHSRQQAYTVCTLPYVARFAPPLVSSPILDLLIWVAVGAIVGVLVAAVRYPGRNDANRSYRGAIQAMVFAATGALVGSAIYVTLAYSSYDYLPFSF